MHHLFEFDLKSLDKTRNTLRRQHYIVSKKISSTIMKRSLAFGSHVKHYSDVKKDVEDIIYGICDARR